MQHGQQPAPQAQELHGASRGAGGAASAKPQQTRAGAGWKGKGQKRERAGGPGKKKGRRREARRHQPAKRDTYDTQRHSPKPALHRQQPPAARHPMAWRLACARLHIHHSSGSFTPLASQPGTPPTSSHPPAQSKHRGRAQRTQRQQRQRSRRPEARKEGLKSREGSPGGAHSHTGSEGRGSRRRQSYLESGDGGIKIDERVPRRQVCLP